MIMLYWELLCHTEYDYVLMSVTILYWVWLCCTEHYYVVTSMIVSYSAPLCRTGAIYTICQSCALLDNSQGPAHHRLTNTDLEYKFFFRAFALNKLNRNNEISLFIITPALWVQCCAMWMWRLAFWQRRGSISGGPTIWIFGIESLSMAPFTCTYIYIEKQNVKITILWKVTPYSSGVPRNFVREGGSTNSVEDRGQRERGSGGGSPLLRGSGASCNLVQEI
jgi:hypothetical protein